jgi:hypothetical protein
VRIWQENTTTIFEGLNIHNKEYLDDELTLIKTIAHDKMLIIILQRGCFYGRKKK